VTHLHKNLVFFQPPATKRSFLCSWSIALLVLAQILCAYSVTAEVSNAEQSYRVMPGDTLSITVKGESELSGAFNIDNAGEISVPLLGPVKMSSLTIAECEQALLKALSRDLIKHPIVYVRLSATRPVSVLGDVKNPGSYAYRFGMLAKSSISLAGGFATSLQITALALLEAEERVALLSTNRDRLAIKSARLEAQLSGAASFALPSSLTVTASLARSIFEEEQRYLHAHNEALAAQRNLLQLQRPRLVSEEDAIANQISSESAQVELLRRRVTAYQQLLDRGIGRAPDLLEINLSLASKEGNVWALKALRARAAIGIMDVDGKLKDLEIKTATQVSSELNEARRQFLEADVMLASARTLLKRRLQDGAAPASQYAHSIKILRSRNDEIHHIDAADQTPLEPGDVVEIRVATPASTPPG
jgi:polysaccharide biosynthesis/export protein